MKWLLVQLSCQDRGENCVTQKKNRDRFEYQTSCLAFAAPLEDVSDPLIQVSNAHRNQFLQGDEILAPLPEN